MEFSGKTAFVTGAANGIGLGICRALARNGVNLVLADIEQSRWRARARSCDLQRPHTRDQVDVSDAAAFERAADEAEAEFGNIHFLFNNAGITMAPKPLWEVTPEQWEWIFGVNIFGVINGIRALVPRMTEARRGRPRRQHRLDRRAAGQSETPQRLLCHDQICRRRGVRSAGARSRRHRTSASPCCARRWSRPRYTPPRNAGPERLGGPFGRPNPKPPGPSTLATGFRPTMSAGACSMRSRG